MTRIGSAHGGVSRMVQTPGTATCPFKLGEQRTVQGITFTHEPTPESQTYTKGRTRWRAWPLAHDVYVEHHHADGWILRTFGWVFDVENLQRAMERSVKRRTAEIAKARRELAEYDAAVTNMRVKGVLAAAQQIRSGGAS